MMDRKLIELIVLEVIKNLNITENQSIDRSKENLLIVGDQKSLNQKDLLAIESKWNIILFDSIENLEMHTVSKVIFLNAKQDLLVKGALGISDTPESELLSNCILEYVPVSLIPADYLQRYIFNDHQNSPNRAYLSQLLGYKDTLGKLGVKVESIASFLNKEKEILKTYSEKSQANVKKKLITHRDVQDYIGDQILVDKNTIITPLARDTARELGKSIKVIDPKGAICSCN